MLRIGELAERLHTTTKTIRHYERVGLLNPPVRASSGYRMYDKTALQHATKVFELRRIGLSVAEVGRLLHDENAETTPRQRLLGLLDENLQHIDTDIGILQGRRDDLSARYRALLQTPRDREGGCICAALLIRCTCGRETLARTDVPE